MRTPYPPRRPSWAVLDEGLLAGANFALSVLLAARLGPVAFGHFATAQAAGLLLRNTYEAAVLTPLFSVGAGRLRARLAQDTAEAFRRLAWRGVQAGLAAGALALVLRRTVSQDAASAALGFGMAIPGWVALALSRRANYVLQNTRSAATATGCYATSLAAVLLALHAASRFSMLPVLAGAGAAAWVAAYVGLRCGGFLPAADGYTTEADLESEALRAEFGLWSPAAAVMVWAGTQLQYVLLSGLSDASSTGSLRGFTLLAEPMHRVNMALTALASPETIRLVHQEGPAGLPRRLWEVLRPLLALNAVYALAAAAALPAVGRILFPGNPPPSPAVLAAVVIPLLFSPQAVVFASGSAAVGRPRSEFWARTVTAAMSVCIGPLLISRYGMDGAAASMALLSVLSAASSGILAWMGWRAARGTRQSDA
ncbi:MAG: hypothetical protein HY928_14030 [Elusimicrobia bacterium]|nr:hypothetical protein [Elusimicrobiota bacterium]